jgi:hypothetical protein
MDYDTLNTIHHEERGYQEWVRERKNQILSMTNVVKKQAEWNKLFPQPTYSKEINSMVF